MSVRRYSVNYLSPGRRRNEPPSHSSDLIVFSSVAGEMETGLQTVLTLLGSSDREVWAGCLDGLASAQQRMQHYLQNVGGGKPGAVSHLRQTNNEVLQRLVGFLR